MADCVDAPLEDAVGFCPPDVVAPPTPVGVEDCAGVVTPTTLAAGEVTIRGVVYTKPCPGLVSRSWSLLCDKTSPGGTAKVLVIIDIPAAPAAPVPTVTYLTVPGNLPWAGDPTADLEQCVDPEQLSTTEVCRQVTVAGPYGAVDDQLHVVYFWAEDQQNVTSLVGTSIVNQVTGAQVAPGDVAAALAGSGPCVPAAEIDQAAPNVRTVCADTGGVLTPYFVRDAGTVDNTTGAVTPVGTEWSPDGINWAAGQPPGTLTPGSCRPNGLYVEPICYRVNNAGDPLPGWALVTTDAGTGLVVVTNYQADATTQLGPLDVVVADCAPALLPELDQAAPNLRMVCTEAAGYYSTVFVRDVGTVNNVTGVTTYTGLQHSLTGVAWVNGGPAGNVSSGPCDQHTHDFEPICYLLNGVGDPLPGWALLVTVPGSAVNQITRYRSDAVTPLGGLDVVVADCGKASADLELVPIPDSEWCIENPPGTFTPWSRRETRVFNSVTAATNSIIMEWSIDGLNWIGSTPVGTIKSGTCTSPTSTQDSACWKLTTALGSRVEMFRAVYNPAAQVVQLVNLDPAQTVVAGSPTGPPLVLDLAFWQVYDPTVTAFAISDCGCGCVESALPVSLGGIVSLPPGSTWSSPAGTRSVSIVPIGVGVDVTGPDGIGGVRVDGNAIDSSTRTDQANWPAGAWVVTTDLVSSAQIVWEAV